jgi:hypothetical protein
MDVRHEQTIAKVFRNADRLVTLEVSFRSIEAQGIVGEFRGNQPTFLWPFECNDDIRFSFRQRE